MLDLPIELRAAIARHAERSYPEECCGILLGRVGEDGVKHVSALIPVENVREAAARARRYLIEPETVAAAERQAAAAGLDVLGFYHSHPDHPARPSEFDREHAWPFWSYVIVAVARGEPGEMTSWTLDDARAFQPEPTTEPLLLLARR